MGNGIKKDDLPLNLQDVADVIGFDAVLKLVNLCGGMSIYIPKKETCYLKARRRSLFEEWEKGGMTYVELAKKYNYTESHIRQILREERAMRMKAPLQKEFDF